MSIELKAIELSIKLKANYSIQTWEELKNVNIHYYPIQSTHNNFYKLDKFFQSQPEHICFVNSNMAKLAFYSNETYFSENLMKIIIRFVLPICEIGPDQFYFFKFKTFRTLISILFFIGTCISTIIHHYWRKEFLFVDFTEIGKNILKI